MKKCLIFAICLFSFSLVNVNATEVWNWGCSEDIMSPYRGYIFDLNGGTNYTDLSMTRNSGCDTSSSTNNSPREFITTGASGENISFGSNGLFFSSVHTTPFLKDNLYSVSFYVCNYFNLPTSNNNYKFYISNSQLKHESVLASSYYSTWKSLDVHVFPSYQSFDNCVQYLGVVKANASGSFVSLHLTGSGQQVDFLSFVGYSVENLGPSDYLTEEDINNAISSSGLASAKSVNEVQNSVDSLKSEVNNMQEQQQETNNKLDEQNKMQQEQNDYLMDDTAPDVDISSLGTVDGLLPAGPIDSLLNIPFKFLSVLTSSLSGTCTPISGTFVFDTTLTIPCFSDVFYDEIPDYLMNFISLIPAGFILIKYFKHLYKKVERATSMETTSDDEWGAI